MDFAIGNSGVRHILLGRAHILDHIEDAGCLVDASRDRFRRRLGKARQVQAGDSGNFCLDGASVLFINSEDVVLETGLQARVFRRRRGLAGQVGTDRKKVHQRRIEADDDQAGKLKDDEGNYALVHLDGLDGLARDAAKIEQRETEWRGQETGLDIEADHDAEPYRRDIGRRVRQKDRRDDRNNHDRDLDKVEEETKQEDHRHDNDELGPEAARQSGQEVLYHLFAAKAAEGCCQHGRAKQDDEDKRGRLGCFLHNAHERVVDLVCAPQAPDHGYHEYRHGDDCHDNADAVVDGLDAADVQIVVLQQHINHSHRYNAQDRRIEGTLAALVQAIGRHDGGSDCADGAGLVYGGNAGNDRAENDKNQRQRRDQREKHLHDEIPLQQLAFIVHGRRCVRTQDGRNQDIGHIKQYKDDARDERSEEHVAGAGRDHTEVRRHREVAGRFLVEGLARCLRLVCSVRQLVGKDNQDDGRRNDLAERSRGANRSGGQRLRIVVAQHGGQRNKSHRDHCCPDDAGRRRQQRADEYDGDAETARHRAEELCHGDEQIFGDLRPLQHDPHENEQRNGNERIPFNFPVNAAEVGDAGRQPFDRTVLNEIGAAVTGKELTGNAGDDDGDDCGTGKRKRHRIARAKGIHHQQEEHGKEKKFHDGQPSTPVSWTGSSSTFSSISASALNNVAVNWNSIDNAKTIRNAAIRYFTYIPKPLIEVSKLNIGLLIRLVFSHMPRNRISQHNGSPKATVPVTFNIDRVRLVKLA